MPTVDELQPVVVASDDDGLPVSQGGILRRVSRAQLLSGTQSDLSLNTGLLGRAAAGFGPPGPIRIGGGLTLSNGVLSTPPQFSVSALPQSSNIGSGDLVAASKGGHDVAVPVSALLAATGADVSGQVVKAASGNARKLSDWLGDGLSVEAFGAVGDGVTDDGAAFAQALASGAPIRLGAKVYRVDGQWTINTPAALVGIPGASTIRRTTQSGGAWIDVSGSAFTAIGITFDGGGLLVDSWGVQISASCTGALFDTCVFANVLGPTLGNGLTIQARDGLSGAVSGHSVRHCTFRNNAVHGLWIQAAGGALVEGCSAFQNGAYGLCLDFNDPAFLQIVRQSSVIACRSWGNERGISIGNYNETNLEPPLWGPGNPDARDILVADNICFDNSAYGIAVSGSGLQVKNNQVSTKAASSSSSGILFNASQSILGGNVVLGPGQFGIDAGGCTDCVISENLVADFNAGINAGGGIDVRVLSNAILNNARAITAFQVETDGAGNNFGIACEGLEIDGNTIQFPVSGGAGILLFDGPRSVTVRGNELRSSDATALGRAMSTLTDQAIIVGNRWNGEVSLPADTVAVDGLTYLRGPEIIDALAVSAAGASVAGIVGQQQFELLGQVTFIRVTAGGSGYSSASIAITGSGIGAQANAYVGNGVLIGVAVVAAGSGYGNTDTQVSILGDGQGAVAVAFVGLPVLEDRRLILECEVALGLQMGGSIGPFDNWTGAGLTIPARSEVICVGAAGKWRAVSFVATDYLAPAEDGSLSLRSTKGDIILQPGSGGFVRITSAIETDGFVSCLGRGSPEGVVIAAPGSEFRNLNGGPGQTLWLKTTGADSTGWTAIG